MKKLALFTSILTLSMMIVVPQVSALEIKIDSNGVMSFYEDGVLGKNSDNDRGQGAAAQAVAKPIRTVAPASGQQLNLKSADDEVKVEVAKQGNSGFSDSETIDAKRVNVSMPANMQQDGNGTMMIQDRAENGAMNGEVEQTRNEYQDQLLQQRQERAEEMIQVRSQLQNEGTGFQIQSREITANLKDGAEFTIDPKTNQVIVTTPSGQEHVLYHLPDQAVERMLEAGVIDSKQEAEDLNLDTLDDGTVLYRTDSVKTKRVFGLIPWQKQTQVLLDDQTGEVLETDKQASSLFEQMLDIFSTN